MMMLVCYQHIANLILRIMLKQLIHSLSIRIFPQYSGICQRNYNPDVCTFHLNSIRHSVIHSYAHLFIRSMQCVWVYSKQNGVGFGFWCEEGWLLSLPIPIESEFSHPLPLPITTPDRLRHIPLQMLLTFNFE